MEVPVDTTDAGLALHEQRGHLQRPQGRGRQGGQGRGDRGARDADAQVGAQVGHEVLAHALRSAPAQRGAEGRQRQSRALDRAEGDHRDALTAVGRRRRQRDDVFGSGVVSHPYAGDADPVVGLGFGDQLQHVAARHDHQPFTRVRVGPDPAGFRGGGAGGLHEQRHGAELVDGKQAGLGSRLNGQRGLHLEQVEQGGAGRRRSPRRQLQAEEGQQLGVRRRPPVTPLEGAHDGMVAQRGQRQGCERRAACGDRIEQHLAQRLV